MTSIFINSYSPTLAMLQSQNYESLITMFTSITLILSKIHISSSNQFLYSHKHFNKHLECNNIQTIVINFPIITLLPKSFQTPFNQLKTSTIISMILKYTCKHNTSIIFQLTPYSPISNIHYHLQY